MSCVPQNILSFIPKRMGSLRIACLAHRLQSFRTGRFKFIVSSIAKEEQSGLSHPSSFWKDKDKVPKYTVLLHTTRLIKLHLAPSIMLILEWVTRFVKGCQELWHYYRHPKEKRSHVWYHKSVHGFSFLCSIIVTAPDYLSTYNCRHLILYRHRYPTLFHYEMLWMIIEYRDY